MYLYNTMYLLLSFDAYLYLMNTYTMPLRSYVSADRCICPRVTVEKLYTNEHARFNKIILRIRCTPLQDLICSCVNQNADHSQNLTRCIFFPVWIRDSQNSHFPVIRIFSMIHPTAYRLVTAVKCVIFV